MLLQGPCQALIRAVSSVLPDGFRNHFDRGADLLLVTVQFFPMTLLRFDLLRTQVQRRQYQQLVADQRGELLLGVGQRRPEHHRRVLQGPLLAGRGLDRVLLAEDRDDGHPIAAGSHALTGPALTRSTSAWIRAAVAPCFSSCSIRLSCRLSFSSLAWASSVLSAVLAASSSCFC